ncbi:MAG: NapC/NirT family cytochrome c [Vicinamibacterales bacterium]
MAETPGSPAELHPVTILRNLISIAGALLATVSVLLFLGFFLADLTGWTVHANPYLGIIFFIVLPTVFVIGLLTIPFGAWIEARRRQHGRPPSLEKWPRLDFNDARIRAVVFAVAVLTPVNMMLVSVAAYKGVEEMDSAQFCGQVCHEVMEPEYTAYQNGPHARVNCVACHIGPGASWFVQSKMSGLRQVFAVTFNTHSRPIQSPVHNLRPARETCAQCHWPTKFHGDKVEVKKEYAEDEANTESVTTLQLRIGGNDAAGKPIGIHWHVAEQNAVDYVALDPGRQQIGYVKLTAPGGVVREYFAPGVTEAQLAAGERRRMDCVDCHNRPSHIFARSAERAINEAMGGGAVARDLPFIRREAAVVLKVDYPTRAVADEQIVSKLTAFYRDGYPALWTSRQADITRSITALKDLHGRNVFPAMKLGWGYHPDNRGHMEFPGCFRCHDGEHTTKDGRTIPQDCQLCHEIS